jgi:hypothetical protein
MKDKYSFKEIIFFDNIFHLNKEWLRKFAAEYKANINVPFKCMAHLSLFDKETAVLLKENCCYAVNFGIQSMDEVIRKRFLSRYTSNQQIESALRICDKAGLSFDVDLIFDLPGENEENIINSARFFKKFRSLNRIKSFNLSYFPRLDIVDIARKERRITDADVDDIENGVLGDPFYLSAPPVMGVEKINRALRNFYKVLPLLPMFSVKYFSSKRRYLIFYFIPQFLVITFQVLIGLKNRDRRFYIYLKDYIRRFRSFFSGKTFIKR